MREITGGEELTLEDWIGEHKEHFIREMGKHEHDEWIVLSRTASE